MTPEQADALQRIAEFGELQSALERGDYFERQFNAEADELKRVRARLAEAEREIARLLEITDTCEWCGPDARATVSASPCCHTFAKHGAHSDGCNAVTVTAGEAPK
jgi:hypothetical protein